MNQQVVFLSDGGDTVRDLQYYLSPESEHLLDWFHITMRLTVMGQMVKGMTAELKPDDKHPEASCATPAVHPEPTSKHQRSTSSPRPTRRSDTHSL